MHMADALLTPQVGGAFWGITAGTIVYCSRKIKKDPDESRIPLMGILGAFIFAAQMINFSIPATGSSGHLGGGMILAILLGPAPAFLTIASVLVVQALFFADGGLLALGCNIFNLGFFPAFIAYPLVFKPIAGTDPGHRRIFWACLLSSLVALQLGSLFVVLQTGWSGISALPFTSFLLAMQPIHLAIGLVEGLVTAVVVKLVWQSQPELILLRRTKVEMPSGGWRKIGIPLLTVTLLISGLISWYASENPDGLEWSIAKSSGHQELLTPTQPVHGLLKELQNKTALLPDYGFAEPAAAQENVWLTRTGTSLSGLIGSVLTLLVALLLGFFVKKRSGNS